MEYAIAQANRLGNRKNNQDRFVAIESGEGVLLVLADGMGGEEGGDVAAEVLVETAKREYLAATRPVSRPKQLFHNIVTQAHAAILRYGQAQTPPSRPATTAVLCLAQDGYATWAHAGDSRLYIYQRGIPLYRTTDHSYVEELYQQGMITRFEQETHPMRNRITKCIGALPQQPVLTYSNTIKLTEGDVILLCSDGLWGGIDDVQIGAMLESNELEQAVEQMAEKAERNNYPSSDNISVLALKLIGAAGSRSEAIKQAGERKHKRQGDVQQTDVIQDAIEQLETVMKEYEDEFK